MKKYLRSVLHFRSLLILTMVSVLSFGICGCERISSSSLPIPISSDGKDGPGPAPNKSSDELRTRIHQVLSENLKNRKLSASDNAAWQIMHGVLAYGARLEIESSTGSVNALDYLLGGGSVNGWDLGVGDELPTTKRTGMKAKLEPGSFIGQGHVDQWIAILSQMNVPMEQKVVVKNRVFTVEDWARQSQWDVSQAAIPEYSWTVMAMTHYFPEDQSWVAKDGKVWTLEQLVQFESEQDLPSSTCGGTHRLMSLARAVRYRQSRKEPMVGGWLAAQHRLDDVIKRVRQYQNEDGSFSSNYTERPGRTTDLSHMIGSTGHMLEFLSFSLPEQELEQPWMTKAVDRLCGLLHATRKVDLECGALYHALGGLRIYYDRRFGTWSPNAENAD